MSSHTSSFGGLEVTVDEAGFAMAIDHEHGRHQRIDLPTASEDHLKLEAIRALIPRAYGCDRAGQDTKTGPRQPRSRRSVPELDELEAQAMVFIMFVGHSDIKRPQYQHDAARYREFVLSTLGWRVVEIQLEQEKLNRFFKTNDPQDQSTRTALLMEALRGLQAFGSRSVFASNQSGDRLQQVALEISLQPTPDRAAAQQLESIKAKAYASGQYAQKRTTSFADYYLNHPVSATVGLSSSLLSHASHSDSYESVAQGIEHALQHSTPYSLIRAGEGEGCFLSYAEYSRDRSAQNEVYGVCGKDIYKVWFDKNIHEATPIELSMIRDMFWSAVSCADIIGVPTPQRVLYEYAHFIADLQKYGFSRGYVGISEILKHLQQAQTDARLVHAQFSDCDMARPLYAWQEWDRSLAYTLPRLLYGRKNVTFITCHRTLESNLSQVLNLRGSRTLLIPPEKGRVKTADSLQGDHLNDHFDQVCAQLQRDPGSIVLVAAGFLGKAYCAKAKAAGSVAVDIGSLADYWIGHNTRAKNAWTIPSPFAFAA